MDSSSRLPLSLNDSFQELIQAYNSPESPGYVKRESLEKINSIVQDSLKKGSLSKESMQEVTDLLKQIQVRSEDKTLWNQIRMEVEHPEVFVTIPTELYSLIFEKKEAIERFDNLSKDSLNLTPTENLILMSPEFKFEIALRHGEEVNKLDLSNFRDLDPLKLKTLNEKCPNLKLLSLVHNLEADLSINLDFFSNLESLNLAMNEMASLGKLPENLKELNLDMCYQLSAEAFQTLSAYLKLERLYVGDTLIATLDGLPKSLKELNLSSCDGLTAEELQKLEAFPQLQKLTVAGTHIVRLDKLPPNIKELDLGYCTGITTKEFQKLDNFPQLQKLKIGGLILVETLDWIPKNLKELDLTHLQNMTADEIKKLTSFDNLEVIYLPSEYLRSNDIISLLQEHNKEVRFS